MQLHCHWGVASPLPVGNAVMAALGRFAQPSEIRFASSHAMAIPDEELVLAMTRGDQEALGLLYERHVGGVLVVIRAVLGDRAQVADIAQDVFLEAWKRATQFDGARGSVRAWLSVIARSRALDFSRRRSQRYKVSLQEEDISDRTPAPIFDTTRLPFALSLLTDRERQVIVLGYLEERSSKDIAEHLGIPVGTVKSRMRSALEKLATHFKENDP